MKRLSAIISGLLVVAFATFGCAQMSSMYDSATGWTTLIDGEKGLENWNRLGNANWRPVDGAIQADKGKGYSYLVSKNSYKDFQIRAEFWVSEDANTGIFMRCQNPKDIHDKNCYEANVFDRRKDPTFGTGAITHLAKVEPVHKTGGKWNTYDITLKGARITLNLNGVRTVDFENSQFASGPFALQWFSGVVKFRKVQIKEL
jgi:hypothetical protein